MDDDLNTIAQALAWSSNQLRATSETPRLDAELLLAHVFGWPRARILAEGRHPLDARQRAALYDLVARRGALAPIAYLIGHKEFYGLDFVVDRQVLIPRPETELLVDLALRQARAMDARRIVDVGTGSGCIAVALATHAPKTRITAIDASTEALAVARLNVARHNVEERVLLLAGDLLAPLDEPTDMIVSNPPYTVLAEVTEGVRRYEPQLALDGGAEGLAIYRLLLAQAPAKLRAGGAILLEIGASQAAAVCDIARTHLPAARIDVHQDLAGRDRVVTIVTEYA